MIDVYLILQHGLVVFVRYIPYHQSGPFVTTIYYVLNLQFKLNFVLYKRPFLLL